MQIQIRKAQNLSENKESYSLERKRPWFAQPSMIYEARTCLIFPLVLALPQYRNVLVVYTKKVR